MPEVPAIQPLDNPLTGLIRLQELQGLAQERQMRGQEFQARAQELQQRQQQMQAAQAAQQRASQVWQNLPRTSDDLVDVSELMRQLGAAGAAPKDLEGFATTAEKMNQIHTSYRQQQKDHLADLANVLLEGHDDKNPVTQDSIHLGLAAAQGMKLASDDDVQQMTSALGQGMDPEHVLKTVRGMGGKWAKPQTFEHAPAGSTIYSKETGQVAGTVPAAMKDKAELAADAANPNSPTAAQSKAALDLLASADKDSAAKQKERYMELEAKRIQGQKLTPAEAAEHKAYERATTLGPEASARLAIVPVQTVNAEGQPVTEYKTRGQALQQGTFEKPLPGTVQNRVVASKSAAKTGEDIIRQVQDPKVAAQLGPAIGRFNTLREFVGNPPPELSELAGTIESYALAQMGVHGMRSVQGAQKVADLMDRKHTPESMIRAIRGINSFAEHYVQEATGKPITPTAAPAGGQAETPYQRYQRGGGTNR